MSDQVTMKPAIQLSNKTLGDLPEGVKVPTYDRASLSRGMVHVGLGNFHRAHQAWYLHRLMQQGKAFDWAIVGAGVRPGDEHMRQRLAAQDFMTTLIELDPASVSAEVIGSMIDFLPVAANNAPLIEALSDPAIRIVSLTVTEGGYYTDEHGDFDLSHDDIVYDSQNPDTPRTVFGAIIAALRARRAAGVAPFTGLSCDNLQGNGDVMRQSVVGLAMMQDPELADWISHNATFPNSMVDCIVPATGENELQLVKSLGIEDNAPVTHESFRQWVIEDNFCNGRPPWEDVGATLTNDVHSYEAMKIRMLNAGHQVVANLGELLNITTISDCMANDLVRGLLRKVETEEFIPYVDAVPSVSASDYLDLIEKRFSNPKIHDTTRRVAFDGSSRHSGFVLPIVRDALAADGDVSGLALVEALWARMCAGVREDGTFIEPNDPSWDELNAVAIETKTRPTAWLEQTHIYGELAENEKFASEFARWMNALWTDGCTKTVQSYLA